MASIGPASGYPAQSYRFDSEAEDEHWRVAVMPYLWAPSFKGSITVKGVTAAADIPFTDLLKALDYAVIGQAEFQYGRFFIIPDTMLVKLTETVSVSGSKLGQFGLINVKGNVSATAELLTYFQELVAGYRVYERNLSEYGNSPQKLSFDILGGIRYYYIDAKVTANSRIVVTGPGGIPRVRTISGSISGSEDWIDPLIGAQIKYDVTERLNLSLRGDVGGFGVGSDRSWSATALGSYQLNDRWNLIGGYRVLDIDYSNGEKGMDARMAGPVIGAQYKMSF